MQWNRKQHLALSVLLVIYGLWVLGEKWLKKPEKAWEIPEIKAFYSLWQENIFPEQYEKRRQTTFQLKSRNPKLSKPKNLPQKPFLGDTVQISTWMAWGCSPKQAELITEAVKRRREHANSEFIAGYKYLPAALREHITPLWINLEKRDSGQKAETKSPQALIQPKIDLNHADSMILLEVPGIGPYLAGKILEIRRKYGGFIVLEQLLFFPGMNAERLERLKERTELGKVSLRPVSLNYCNRTELAEIPGLNRRIAEKIIQYRNRYGLFESVNLLAEKGLMPDSILELVRPYLYLEP